MNSRQTAVLAAAACLMLSLATSAHAAPEGLSGVAAAAVAAAPTAAPATPAARPATRTVRRPARTTRPATRIARPVSTVRVASSSPVACHSIACMGGVLLLGVGF